MVTEQVSSVPHAAPSFVHPTNTLGEAGVAASTTDVPASNEA